LDLVTAAPLILPKEGGIASKSSRISLTFATHGVQRFARPGYHLARSSPGFRLATAYNLGSQSRAPSTGLGQRLNPFRTKGRYSSYRQPRSRLLQPHFCDPKEAEGILVADNRPIPVKPVLTGSSFQDGNHQLSSCGDTSRRLGSTGPTGHISPCPRTSRLPALSSKVEYKVRTDSLPGLHIHQDSLLHPCGNNVLPPDRIVKILSRIWQLSALKFCQAREFLSLRPVELSSRQNPTREVAHSTSPTSPTLQMEIISGSPASGSSPSRNLTTRILGIKSSSRSGSAVTAPPNLSTFTDASNDV
jgi:hypothetical protein